MKIHIIETNKKPASGEAVKANCGKKVVFKESIEVLWGDGRICQECLEAHKMSCVGKKTFAFVE